MRTVRACAILTVLTAVPAAAGDGATVTACDTLLAARRLDAAAGTAEPDPGCRRIDRSAVGTVERRAMIGGAPYECLTVAGRGGCLWIVP